MEIKVINNIRNKNSQDWCSAIELDIRKSISNGFNTKR